MSQSAPSLRRFLAAVHRRAVVLRAAERSALGLLGGAAVAACLIPLLWWNGQPAVPATLAAAAVGTAAGFTWAVARRPSRLDAAMLADEQLGLHDLLGTAASAVARAGGDQATGDAWERSVVAVADARCRSLRPRDVVLRRLGVRAWGGIGLSAALALTLAALAGTPTGSHAAAPTAASNDAARTAAPPGRPPAAGAGTGDIAASRPARRPRRRPRPAARRTARGRRPAARAVDPAKPGGHRGRRIPNRWSRDRRGWRLGIREDRPHTDAGDKAWRGVTDVTPPTATSRPATAGTRPSGGTAAGTGDGTVTGNAGRTAGGAPSTVVPPWLGQGWGQDVRAAREQLDAGHIPPAYRDLVRDFFDAR